jgi:hypothetical protein
VPGGTLTLMDTGFPAQDAQADFSRARRRQMLSHLVQRLRGEPDDVDVILPFEEVVEALGYRGERRLGVQTIPLDSIVGTVDRSREFDRSFRPKTRHVRSRWQRIALAIRRGESMPPIDVYRIGDLHFVRDGHHRVSVARSMRLKVMDATVTEVLTELGADREIELGDLPMKSHQRLFFERVPLPPGARGRISLQRASDYAQLAESVEAWGFRATQARQEFMTREQVAIAWFEEEYQPVVELMRAAGLVRRGTETEAYVRLAGFRYLLLRTHEWNDEVIERIREELERSPRDEDTLVHELRRELR